MIEWTSRATSPTLSALDNGVRGRRSVDMHKKSATAYSTEIQRLIQSSNHGGQYFTPNLCMFCSRIITTARSRDLNRSSKSQCNPTLLNQTNSKVKMVHNSLRCGLLCFLVNPFTIGLFIPGHTCCPWTSTRDLQDGSYSRRARGRLSY